MNISLEELIETIKVLFDKTKLSSIETVYEKIYNSDNLKLILFFHNVFYNNTNIIYTKLIFIVDKDKKVLIKNNFMYLYDINCEYKKVEFDDISDFKNKIKNIFDNKIFGEEIKFLSNFMKNPTTIINDWLYKNDITNKSVFGFKYEPKMTIMPCKSLFFNFIINLDDKFEISLIIIKEKDNKYELTFKLDDKTKTSEITSLQEIIQEIGFFIKEKT